MIYLWAMNLKKIATYTGIAAGVYMLVRFTKKGLSAKQLNVKISNLKLAPISKAAITLSVINPTNTEIDFDSITADILLNGNAFSTVNLNRKTIIKANSSLNVDLPIKLNPLEGARLALDLLKNPKQYTLNIKGTVNSSSINFPFDIEYKLK